jgi:hypothetical protein
MTVEVDGARQTIEVSAGTSVDVFGKRIRVKAATGGDSCKRAPSEPIVAKRIALQTGSSRQFKSDVPLRCP